ncbi:MAG: KH domain-containing protein [bacterium]|jgi:predicted RNA-binding protein YlqC (UPF0109 family)|nr:KH domain-containing protein [bacterium]
MKDLLLYLSKSLVKHPEDVLVGEKELEDGTIEYSLKVNPEDMGRIIGRNGKTARAIRLLVSARGSMINKRTQVEIKED